MKSNTSLDGNKIK